MKRDRVENKSTNRRKGAVRNVSLQSFETFLTGLKGADVGGVEQGQLNTCHQRSQISTA